MEQINSLIESYGLLTVVIGVLASILCGCIKTPIVNAIKKKDLGEKATTKRITTVCTILVAAFSIIMVALYYCIKAKSLAPFTTLELYSQILLSITFAKIAYALYEGVGSVSLKKWLHSLWDSIKNKLEGEKVSSTDEYIKIIQDILTESLHMPMTEAQQEMLKSKLEKKILVEDKSDEQKEN